MKNFYMKHQDKIVIISDVMIIVLGLLSGKKTFALIGLLLLILSIYVFAVKELVTRIKTNNTIPDVTKKKIAKKEILKAKLKALRMEQKRDSKGRKKKSKKKKRR